MKAGTKLTKDAEAATQAKAQPKTKSKSKRGPKTDTKARARTAKGEPTFTERKDAEEAIRRHNKALELISDSATKFLHPMPFRELLQGIGERLHRLTGDSLIIINEYEAEAGSTRVHGVYGEQLDLGRLTEVIGREVVGLSFKVDPDTRGRMIEGRFVKVEGGIHELTFGQMPKPLSETIQREFRIRAVYAMPFSVEEDLLGTVALLTRDSELLPFSAIETLVNLAAVALKRARAEEALRQSEERYRRFFEDDLAGNFIATPDGRIIDCNPAFLTIFGFSTKEEALSANLIDVYPSSQEAEEFFALLKEAGRLEYRGGLRRRRDGAEIHVVENVIATFEEDNDGTLTQIKGYVFDDTERRRAEEEVRKARDELEIRVQERTAELVKVNRQLAGQSKIMEGFFRHTITPIVLLDKDFNFVRVNDAYAKACDREASEFPGNNHFEFYPSDTQELFEQVRETKRPYQAMARPFTFADHPEWGETYWDWVLVPLLDEKGEVEHFVFSLNDVTQRMKTQKGLWQSQELLRKILDTLPAGVLVADPSGRIFLSNPEAKRIWGGARYVDIPKYGEYRGRWADTGKPIAPEDWPLARAIRKGETSLDDVVEIETFDGKRKTILTSAVPLRDFSHLITGAIMVNQDITQKKEMEDRIGATNALLGLFAQKGSRKEYLDSVVELLHRWTGCRCIGLRVLDRSGLIPYDSFLGFSKEFWESENSLSVGQDQCVCTRVFKEDPDPQDLQCMTRDGSFYCNNTARFVGGLSKKEQERYRGVCMKVGYSSLAVIPVGYQKRIISMIHLADESEDKVPLRVVQFIESLAPLMGEALNRFSLEEALRESEKHLKILSSQLITVQERERKRIAQELHDSLGQTLSALKFGIEDAASKVGQHGKGATARSLEALVSMVRNAVDETRRISADLRPSILDDLGILPTINWLCREFQKVYAKIGIEAEIDLEETDVSKPLKTVIYRVLQEVLSNIAKHSSADRVRLFLGKRDGTIRLVIEDNGKGFDTAAMVTPESPDSGFGLRGIKERIELLRGVLTIESKEGLGTTIRAAWPE